MLCVHTYFALYFNFTYIESHNTNLPNMGFQNAGSRKVHIFLAFFIQLSIVNCVSNQEPGVGDDNGPNGGTLPTLQTIAISFGCMTGLICCTVCTWSFWRRLCFGSSTGNMDIPDPTYDDGISYRYRSTGFQPLDPNTLVRRNGEDRVTFDPIPTLPDLHIDPRGSFEMQSIKVPSITSITGGGEMDVHAQDWFEDPVRRNFPRDKIEYLGEIGKGWFGKVVEAMVSDIVPIHKSVKAIVKMQRDDCEDRDQMRYLHEARFYRDSNNASILKLLGYCIERAPYLLIYESWPLGDLKYYLITNADNGEKLYKQGTLARMAIEIAKGLEYMGQMGYVHGDLAARNCLVCNTNGKVVIGDYGLATQRYKDDYYWNGRTAWPIRWAAPESLHCIIDHIQATKITVMSNVWSYAVVLWEIFELGKTPYPELTNEAVLDQVISAQTYVLEAPRTNYLTSRTKDTLYDVMRSCWNEDPEFRPTISSILQTLSQVQV